jgi:murein DD-endopeptidase MepM/ murein hydrolase activator NlpD
MRITKTKTKILFSGVLIALVLILGSFLVVKAADSTTDKSKEKAAAESAIEKKQQKVDEIQKEINRYTADLARLEQDVQTLAVRIKVSQNEIELTNLAVEKTAAEIEQTDSQIEITRQQVEEKEKDMQLQKKVLATVLRDIKYRDDNTSTLSLLLQTSTFADVLSIERQNINFQNDAQNTFDRILRLRDDLLAKHNDLKDQRQQQQDLKAQLEAQQGELENQKQNNEQLLAQTQNSEDRYLELIGEAANKQKQLAQEIQQLEQSNQTKGGAGGGTGGPAVTGSGLFIPPMSGALSSISQGYGLTSYAASGVYGYDNGQPRIHAGVDFALPAGTAVYAVADGVVDGTTSLKYGFGNTIVILHDKLNLYTLYGHLSQIAVTPGQIVKQGDIIGFEGTTGFSSGYHLHFAVYTKMQWVETSYGLSPWYAPQYTLNPMNFF